MPAAAGLAVSVEELAPELRPAPKVGPRPFDVDPATRRFYLPVAAITVLLIPVLLMNGKLTRWGGALLLAAYVVFAIDGYLVLGPAADPVAG